MTSLPSPASSPSLTPSDSTAQLNSNRKRQRSRSMQSDTSTASVKRSVSEGNSLESVRSDQMSSLTIADSNQDIDAYMAEQGEADIPQTLSLTPPPEGATQSTMSTSDEWSLSASEKWQLVDRAKNKPMTAGETWYLVSREWWKLWARAVGGLSDKEAPVPENEVGPVDNSPLLDASGRLTPGVVEGVQVEFVPAEVWSHFDSWYGPANHAIPRRVIERGMFGTTTVLELYPAEIKVFRLSRDSAEKAAAGPHYPTIQVSMGDTLKDLCTRVADAVKIDPTVDTPYRVWRPTAVPDDWRSIDFPTSSLEDADAKVIDESPHLLENQNIMSGDAFIVEFKQPDGWLIDTQAAAKKPVAAIEPPPPLFDSKNSFFNRLGTSSSTVATTKASTELSTAFTKPTISINKSSFTKTLEPGTLGLGNMGNTCFMNSALQCLAHTKELTEYFLNGVFKAELNRDNPLGMQGQIAEVFGALLERIWASSGPSTSYSPREFKQTLQRFAPQFSGYQQHDSQELVAFLLDGLHEDLNRVIKKPYVEKPDWEGGGDAELVKLAAKSWEGYMLRNDSVIVDLFQGQYQSTLVCPECEKISITFDPFMYLTLPLPVQKKWKHTIFYVPWDLEKPHVKVPIEINRDSSFRDLRNVLGRWVGAIPENLLMLEIFQHKFYKLLDDSLPVNEMSETDVIVCFELPCNARMNRTYKKKEDDPFILPLFLCDAKPTATRGFTYRSGPSLFGYPAIVVVDRGQATTVDAIYDAVITRLQRWTKNARDLYDWEVSSEPISEVSIPVPGFPPLETVTEITPTAEGEVVVQSSAEESVIVDEKNMVVDEEAPSDDVELEVGTPRPYRTKKDVFTLKIYTNQKEYGAGYGTYSRTEEWATWEHRLADQETGIEPFLIRQDDALYAEFDENMKAYYFGDSKLENARWDEREWEEFVHPELAANQKADSLKQRRGITLQDCLEEFVKEEQLGEDDLWYCPSCKKHQQATKKFDLWKAPDILVVHLKRFSNNRILRDKIDTFVDFPVEGLDLGDKVGERAVATRLKEQGVELEELKTVNLDEPLVYDLFAVDEHMGGLGGGHYRAYASNHLTGKWYHFDDGYVKQASAEESVNSNAYLLFYRRRSSKPLGGETYQRAMQKKPQVEPSLDDSESTEINLDDSGLPTPPSEGDATFIGPSDRFSPSSSTLPCADYWNRSNPTSSGPSPPNDDPPTFEDAQSDPLVIPDVHESFAYDSGIYMSSYRRTSPTSSNEAEADGAESFWDELVDSGRNSPSWEKGSRFASPSHSESQSSDLNLNPFDDQNVQRIELDDDVKDEADVTKRA